MKGVTASVVIVNIRHRKYISTGSQEFCKCCNKLLMAWYQDDALFHKSMSSLLHIQVEDVFSVYVQHMVNG